MQSLITIISEDRVSIKELGTTQIVMDTMENIPFGILEEIKDEVRNCRMQEESTNIVLSSSIIKVSPLSRVYRWFKTHCQGEHNLGNLV
jgi:hypothetical protein